MKKFALAIIIFCSCENRDQIQCKTDSSINETDNETDSIIIQSIKNTEKFDSLSVNFDESIKNIKEKLEHK